MREVQVNRRPDRSGRRPRIALGAILGTLGGPRTVALELAGEICRIDREADYFLLTDAPPPAADLGALDGGPEVAVIPMPLPAYRILWEHVHVPRLLRRKGVDLYHGTKNVLPIGCPCPALISIYDLACFRTPETFTAAARLFLRLHTRHAARRAARIIVPSESTRGDLVDLLGVDPGRIDVVPLGVSRRFRPTANTDKEGLRAIRAKYKLPERVITYVGTLQPRKHIHTLVEAFGRLKHGPCRPHRLIVAGRRGWMAGEITRTVRRLGLDEEVIFTGAVPDEELPLFYAASELFVSAGAYEGFGLTLLEAMACGVPVIGGDAGACAEVVGDAGILVSPGHVDALAEAIGRVTEDRALREEMRARGLERAKRFTWRRSAEATIEVYRKVLHSMARDKASC